MKINTTYIIPKERHIYGSSRVGVRNSDLDMLPLPDKDFSMTTVHYSIGSRTYELSNPLPSVQPSAVGNVLSVISDKVIPVFPYSNVISEMRADIRVAQDYSPFTSPTLVDSVRPLRLVGVTLDGRNFAVSEGYRYGFNRMEKDDEIKGSGNSYDFGARIYDSRLGRWLSVDSLGEKYPNESAYCFVGNSPLIYIDPDGNTKIIILTTIDENGHKTSIGIVDYNDVVYMWKNTGTDIYRAVFDLQIEFTYDKRTGKTTRVKTICEKEVDAVEYLFRKTGEVLSDFDKKIAGKGGEVKSGIYLVSKNDGAESTKFTATENCEMSDVTDLIAYFSALPYGSLPDGVGEKINTAISKAQDLKNVHEDVKKGMNLKTKDEEYGIQNSKNVPETPTYSNIIMWRKPKSSTSNTGTYTEATPKQKAAGDTLGGNPTINVYPKK